MVNGDVGGPAFHFIITESVGTMKGCGRLPPFSIITYHLSPFIFTVLTGRLFYKDGNVGMISVQ